MFLLTELCAQGSDIVCVDHFEVSGGARTVCEDHSQPRIDRQTTPRVLDREFSVPALMTLLAEEMNNPNPGYDWIYVDGSHEADDTFLDGELVWRLAKGVIVIFDDYHWDKEPTYSIHHPQRGIDAFMILSWGIRPPIESGFKLAVSNDPLEDFRNAHRLFAGGKGYYP